MNVVSCSHSPQAVLSLTSLRSYGKAVLTKKLGLSPRQEEKKKAVPAVGGTGLEIKYLGFCIFPVGLQKVILALTYFCAIVISDSKYAWI